MAYGKIKADTLVFDNSGSDVDLVVSEIATVAGVTFTGNVSFDGQAIVKGDSTNGSGELTLNCENNSHGIKIKGPPHSAGATYTLTLPNNTGTNGQVLTTNGSGVSSWSTIDISSALPLAGGQMTGNITFSGTQTVDGRDVSVDGTKLDGIETAATADQTAAEILTAIKTVDGASSGLDADLLDGQHGTYYTSYADTAVANLVDSSPATLDTLNELAAALGDDPNFATTVTNSIATKLPLTGGTLTGGLTGTTGSFSGALAFANGKANAFSNTNGVDLQLRSDTTSDQVFAVYKNGASSSNRTAFINSDGTATFAGNVDVKRVATDVTGGGVLSRRDDTTDHVWRGYLGTVSNPDNSLTSEIFANGNASFAGSVTSSPSQNSYGFKLMGGAAELGGIYRHSGGAFIWANNSSGVTKVTLDGTNGNVTATGNASFAGSMTVSGTGQYTGGQRGAVTTLTDAGAIYPNFAAANNFTLTIAGNRTIHNPTNQTAGQHGVIRINQDGTGGRVPAFASNWKFPGGTAPTFSTAANAQDLLAYYVAASGTVYAQLITDLK
jgi:hypothetical protein